MLMLIMMVLVGSFLLLEFIHSRVPMNGLGLGDEVDRI